jgi:hypothetical protein
VSKRFLFSLFTLHFSLFTLLFSLPSFAQSVNKVKNEAFIAGEHLKYRAYYDSYLSGKVTAGVATLDVKFEKKNISGREVYQIIGEGHSKGAFSLFYKVDDRFESFTDCEYLVPWMFIRRTLEGDYKYSDDIKFNQFSGSYSSTRANKKMPAGTHDILSALYYARTLDFSNVRIGDTFPVNFLLDDSVYVSVIKYVGRDDVMIDAGNFHCLRFQPMVITGNVFSQPYPMDVWITDDKNHLPVLAKSGVIVGSVKMELIEYKGLANPLTSKFK